MNTSCRCCWILPASLAAHIIELTAGNFELSLKCPGGVRRVYMAPEEKELSFRQEGEYITVTVPEFTGFSMVVFE